MHWDTFKQDNYSTVGGDGGCRVGEVRAGTTSPMPDHKGFKLQLVPEIHPLHFQVNCQKFSTLRVNCNQLFPIITMNILFVILKSFYYMHLKDHYKRAEDSKFTATD